MSKRSVCSIHIGQCGIQMGKSAWELFNFEHDIQNDGSRHIPEEIMGTNYDNFRTFYYETASGKYVPKALFIDSEPSVMDSLRQSSLGGVVHKNFMINSNQDCRNVMGLAWYPIFCGSPFHDLVKQQVRRLRELCDSVSGTINYLSTCGGTGTGFSCRVLEELRTIDPKSINYSIAQTISPQISNNPLETKNFATYLGITRHDNLAMNMHIFYDNEALYRQGNRLLGPDFKSTYENINQLVAMSISSYTASLRFDGQLNVDLNEFETNLVPIPTLNCVFSSMAPLDIDEDKEIMSTQEITLQAFEPAAFMCSVDPFALANRWTADVQSGEYMPSPPWVEEAEKIRIEMEHEAKLIPKDQWTISHKFLAACVLYRGDLMPATINRAMQTFVSKRNPEFVQWVPSGFKVGINSPPMRTPMSWPMRDMSRSITCLINNTVVVEKLKQLIHNHRLQSSELQGYDVWTATGGIEGSLVESCIQGIGDQISQYEMCMTTKTPISDIKSKLAERPQPLGKF